jgi:hypothetical protein
MRPKSQTAVPAPSVLEPLAVTTRQAAQLLSVSPSEVRKLARRGLLSYRKISQTNWMFSMKSLRQFAEGGAR